MSIDSFPQSRYRQKLSMKKLCCIFLIIATFCSSNGVADIQQEEKLFSHVFGKERGYNKLIRPVKHFRDTVIVNFQLVVRQLLDVDEKHQLMSTNVWMKQSWYDRNLCWEPNKFDNVTYLKVPAEYIWIPDIVLIGNTDGNFSASHMTRAVIRYDGQVVWEPPASFKSWCKIDVTYFPFDVQNCSMKFASWTYDEFQVALDPVINKVDLTHLQNNGEWEIVQTDVQKQYGSNKIHKTYQSVDVVFGQHGLTYCFIMRRLPLFYTVFLITPCLGISFLTALVFYLPSDSQEKITLCISVLLAHTFYLLVITEIIPSTSNAIPLIGEYLLFTMIFITLSIIITTAVINVHYRTNTTHRSLPIRLRYILLTAAPRILCLREFSGRIQWNLPLVNLNASVLQNGMKPANMYRRSTNPYLATALKCVRFFVKRIKQNIRHRRETEEWMYAAMVMDRIFLALFLFISFVGTIVLFFPAWVDYSNHSTNKET